MKEKRKIRHFSEAFKIEKVKMLEEGQVTVRQLSRIYQVTETAIYKWVRKYSTRISRSERIVVEKESEGSKTIELLQKIGDLERKVGQKQLQIDYLEKLLELGSEEAGFDIKKKFASGHLNGLTQGNGKLGSI
ncbi:MAG: transposase [Desulfuromonadales bacterium]|nr:transposase [Desulfuromonadales bacterium]